MILIILLASGQTHWEINLFKRDERVATLEPFVWDKAPGYASLARGAGRGGNIRGKNIAV